jgi:hypothetical protein
LNPNARGPVRAGRSGAKPRPSEGLGRRGSSAGRSCSSSQPRTSRPPGRPLLAPSLGQTAPPLRFGVHLWPGPVRPRGWCAPQARARQGGLSRQSRGRNRRSSTSRPPLGGAAAAGTLRRGRTAGQCAVWPARPDFPGGGRACVCNRPLSGAPGPRTPPGGPGQAPYAFGGKAGLPSAAVSLRGAAGRPIPGRSGRSVAGRPAGLARSLRLPRATRPEPASGHVRAGERISPAALPRRLPQPPGTAVLRVQAPLQHQRGQPGTPANPSGPAHRRPGAKAARVIDYAASARQPAPSSSPGQEPVEIRGRIRLASWRPSCLGKSRRTSTSSDQGPHQRNSNPADRRRAPGSRCNRHQRASRRSRRLPRQRVSLWTLFLRRPPS